jgi:hypothetical protein
MKGMRLPDRDLEELLVQCKRENKVGNERRLADKKKKGRSCEGVNCAKRTVVYEAIPRDYLTI